MHMRYLILHVKCVQSALNKRINDDKHANGVRDIEAILYMFWFCRKVYCVRPLKILRGSSVSGMCCKYFPSETKHA